MGSSRLTLKCRPSELESLDYLSVDVLALMLFREDRLLKGAAGYCDWRLNGRISQLIRSGLFSGKPNELLLIDTVHRIGTERIMLFSQGNRHGFGFDDYSRNTQCMFQRIKKAGFIHLALELPDNTAKSLGFVQTINCLLTHATDCFPGGELTLLYSDHEFSEQTKKIAASNQQIRFELSKD